MRGSPRPLRFFLVSAGETAAEVRLLIEIVEALGSRGHHLEVAIPPGGMLERRLARGRARLLPFRAGRWGLPWSLLRLRRRLLQCKPDALLLTDPVVSRYINKMKWLFDLPSLTLEVEWGTSATPAGGNPAGESGRGLCPDGRVRPGVATLPSGSVPDRVAARRQLHLPRHGALVLVVGPLGRESSHRTLLEALGALHRRRVEEGSVLPVPTLVIAGSGPDEHELRALTQEAGIRDRVIWLGYVDDLETYVSAADVLFVASTGAEFVWTVLDAAAREVAVIAPDRPGYRAFVEPGMSGTLFGDGDASGLASTLDGLLHDPQLASRWGRAGRQRVEEAWSHTALGSEIEALTHAFLLRRSGWAWTAQGRRALLVDRDGTLVVNEPYNSNPERVTLEPEVGPALRAACDAGLALVITSNQSAVARGLCTVEDVEQTNARLRALLRQAGVELDAVYYCPHHPSFGPACDCRKPAPGMLLRAARDLGLDLAASFAIGDAERDLEAGRRAGARALGYRRGGAAVHPQGGVESGDGMPLKSADYGNWLELIRDLLEEAWESQAGR